MKTETIKVKKQCKASDLADITKDDLTRKKPRGAKPGEQRALREDRSEVKSSQLFIRCKRSDKAMWVRAANAKGQKLGKWVTEQLNDKIV